MKNVLKTAGSLMCMLALTLFISCGKDDGGESSPDPVLINFTQNELTVAESDGSVTITVDFDEEMPEDAHFTVQVYGTATFEEDYTVDEEKGVELFHIFLEKGQTSATFTLNLVDDAEIEEDETIILELASDLEVLWPGDNAILRITLTSEDYEEFLVSVERSTGKMYQMSTTDGSMSELLQITYQGAALTGLRSFVYDESSELGYLGSSNQGDGHFFSLDMTSGDATLLNDNSGNVNWDGISDLLIDGDLVLGSLYLFDDNNSESGLAWLNKTTGELDSYLFYAENDAGYGVCCGGALAWIDGHDAVYYGSEYGEYYNMNKETGVLSNLTTLSTDNIAPFESDHAGFTLDEINVQDFAVDQFGTSYAVISYDYGKKNYLVSIDLPTGKIEYIRSFEAKNDNMGLAFVPASVFE